ncbi:hypothetical protein FRC17_007267 [Serendipita sp. 399]|nr:hypothetical protein FRC17_007267 [Serendipita sp. 399]
MPISIDANGVNIVGQRLTRIIHEYANSVPGLLLTEVSMPFMSTAEVSQLSEAQRSALSQLDTEGIRAIGVARHIDILYIIVIWNAGYLFRKQVKLPASSLFSIRLSNLVQEEQLSPQISELLIPMEMERFDDDTLDHLSFAFLHSQILDMSLAAARVLTEKNASERAWLRLGDASFQLSQFKLAMLAYSRILVLGTANAKLVNYTTQRILRCAAKTEWGTIFLEEEIDQIPPSLSTELLRPWGKEIYDVLCQNDEIIPATIAQDYQLYTPKDPDISLPLPPGFRWLAPFNIAISSSPTCEAHVDASAFLGIEHFISFASVKSAWASLRNIKETIIPISSIRLPSLQLIDNIFDILSDNAKRPCLVHCADGVTFTGIIAACYLAAYRFHPPSSEITSPAMKSEEAISLLNSHRPGSVVSEEQKTLVAKWISVVWKRQSILRPQGEEPFPCALEVLGDVPKDADLLVCVGLQGSGKSWFARALRARNANAWKRVSQDETGSRSQCETDISRDPLGKRVILDRCNPTSDDRIYWRRLAHWAERPVLVWFDYPKELCESRAQRRLDHPTLVPGPRVSTAISSMASQLERPPADPTSEGFMGVAIIRSFSACNELVSLLSPPVNLYKFPRTPHLINLGAVTEDDVQVPESTDPSKPSFSIEPGSCVVITEKIDGANLAFSLNPDGRIVVQNRAHWVNSKTHVQFKHLDLWVDEHREGLYSILSVDETFPQRYVLFGEWVVCVHSIHYSRLPDRFLVFDLYDRTTGTFASRDVIENRLRGTGIGLVPVIERRVAVDGQNPSVNMPTHEELISMVQRPSLFYDGRVEGVYVKVERAGKVLERGKVVRGDFIAGNEHWTKGILTFNGIVECRMDTFHDEFTQQPFSTTVL